MAKRDSKQLLGELILRAEQLTAQDKQTLIARLQQSLGQPDHFLDLQTAMREAGILVAWTHFTEPERKRVATICSKVAELHDRVSDVRARHILLAHVCRRAVANVERRTGVAQRSHVLEALDTLEWRTLLDEAFPGYPLELLGTALCAKSTGSPSLKKAE